MTKEESILLASFTAGEFLDEEADHMIEQIAEHEGVDFSAVQEWASRTHLWAPQAKPGAQYPFQLRCSPAFWERLKKTPFYGDSSNEND